MALSARGATDFAPLRRSLCSGWMRGLCRKPKCSKPTKRFNPSGLSPPNPRIVHLALKVHHRSAEFVEHHPCCLVTSQTELTLQQKRRDATLIGGHQWELRVVKHCPRPQRYLVPTPSTLPASQPGQFASTLVPA